MTRTDHLYKGTPIKGLAIKEKCYVMTIKGEMAISDIHLISLFDFAIDIHFKSKKEFRSWFDNNPDMYDATIYVYNNRYKLLLLFGNILKDTEPHNIIVNQVKVTMYRRLVHEHVMEVRRKSIETDAEFTDRVVQREREPQYNRSYCTFQDIGAFANNIWMWNIYVIRDFLWQLDRLYTDLGTRLKVTPAGCGFNIMKNNLSDHIFIDTELDELFRSAIYGGRNEVYISRDINQDLYYYDVNSLYPHVMRNIIYPDPNKLVERWPDEFDRLLHKEEGMAGVTINIPDVDIPPLPFSFTDTTIYPTGEISGTWCFPEIRMALQQGCEIVDVHNVVSGPGMDSPFIDFVDRMMELRLEYKEKGDDTMARLIKNTMNYSAGKLAYRRPIIPENIWFDPLTIGDNTFQMLQNGMCHLVDVPHVRGDHTWVSGYAYILSQSRVMMNSALHLGGDIFYTDTDSLTCSDELPGKIIDDDRLGYYALEYEIDRSYFKMPKFYMFSDINRRVRRVTAGIRNNQRVSYQGLKSDSIKLDGEIPLGNGRLISTPYTVSLEYKNRLLNPDGSTTPIRL